MAITLGTIENKGDLSGSQLLGTACIKRIKVTFDSSYPTGGYSITPRMIGTDVIVDVLPGPVYVAAGAGTTSLDAAWDPINSKLQLYWSGGSAAAQAQVASTTDVHTYACVLTIFCKGG